VNFLAEFSHFFAKQINAKKEKISDEIKNFRETIFCLLETLN